ncbi:uncharacterized protein [Heptranchias perlo]|uniref:uncharacterized protein n=1 Tax=Heptranchias perlo TaxID=212740 RepID=UPI00355A7DAD
MWDHLWLTKFYRDRLEQAIEEVVDGVSSLLTDERNFSGQEHRKVTDLVDKGNRADSSKLVLNLVMEKGSRARRVMWESFVKMHHAVPKLDKILKEMQELGPDPFDYMNIGRGLSEIPSHLKDVQQKHKETLRVQTETLRVNTILIKEKVKIFQLVTLYTELTVISTVRDRTLVEHELLARGRDHEEWREKHLRRELEKIRINQLYHRSFSRRGSLFRKMKGFFQGSSSWSSAAVSGVAGIGKTTVSQILARVTVGSVETLTFSELLLTPIDCVVLSHVIELCDTIKELDLENCSIQCEGLQRLGPALHKCQVLR